MDRLRRGSQFTRELDNKQMSRVVNGDYAVEIDEMTPEAWRQTLGLFADANIYQTWDYHSCCHPRSRVSRLALRYRGQVVAAVQSRIVVIPLLGRGLAHIRWGPVWGARDEPPNHSHLRRCVDAIVEEYAANRKLAIQIVPAPAEDDRSVLQRVLAEAGFIEEKGSATKQTIIVNLERSVNDLYDGLHKKWRNCLNYARREAHEVVEGDSDELFGEFARLYDKMRQRKSFETSTNLAAFRALQKRLESREKMRVFLCRSGTDTCAGAILSLLGDTGVYLFGASDGPGLRMKSSYLLQWRAIEWLKENRARRYDLNGINPTSNPGGYSFKTRLAGRNGQEVSVRPFVTAGSPLSGLLAVTGPIYLRAVRRARHALGSLIGNRRN